MENASKALIMAGEILIALLIIAVLVYGYTNIRNLSKTEEDSVQVEQLATFNKVYESYHRKLLRGVDVISLINRAIDNNIKYDYAKYYTITIKFRLEDDLQAYVIKKVWNEDKKMYENKGQIDEKIDSSLSLKKNPIEGGKKPYSVSKSSDEAYETLFNRDKTSIETFNDFKRRIFDCSDIKYNEIGRVCEITFTERKQDLTQGIIE